MYYLKLTFCMIVLLPLLYAENGSIAGGKSSFTEQQKNLKTTAEKYYLNNPINTAHEKLKEQIEANSGNIELTKTYLLMIMHKSIEDHIYDTWTDYSVDRLLALTEAGLINDYDDIATVLNIKIKLADIDNYPIEGDAAYKKLVDLNNKNLMIRYQRARFYHTIGSQKAQAMYMDIVQEIDRLPADNERKLLRKLIYKSVQYFDSGIHLKGNSVIDLIDSNLERQWQTIARQSPANIAKLIHSMIYQSVDQEVLSGLKDNSRVVSNWQVLDNHLIKQKKSSLNALRRLQDHSARVETPDDLNKATDQELLQLYRHYPWSSVAHEGLMILGSRALWSGGVQTAIRSFLDVLNHSNDAKVIEKAEVAYWFALSQLDDQSQFLEVIAKADKTKKYAWMNGAATIDEIRQAVIRESQAITKTTPELQALNQYHLKMPSQNIWQRSPYANRDKQGLIELNAQGDLVMMSTNNLLKVYDKSDLNKTLWWHRDNHQLSFNTNVFFQPTISQNKIFYRWSDKPRCSNLSAFDLKNGRAIFNIKNLPPPKEKEADAKKIVMPQPQIPRPGIQRVNRPETSPLSNQYIISHPTVANGKLYYLKLTGDMSFYNHKVIKLVCHNQQSGKLLWQSDIIKMNDISDLKGSFKNIHLNTLLFTNKITIKDGAAYCMAGAGFVAKCDIRDGQLEWLHYYKHQQKTHYYQQSRTTFNLGGSPLIKDEFVICSPRDAKLVFALDIKTGELVWENPLLNAYQQVGLRDNILIIRGKGIIAGLDADSGTMIWHQKVSNQFGRAQLIGNSLYYGSSNKITKVNVQTGLTDETLAIDRDYIHNFLINDNDLFLLSDQMDRSLFGKVLNPFIKDNKSEFMLPIKKSWQIKAVNPKLYMPSVDSDLNGKFFVVNNGLFSSYDATAKGRLNWQFLIPMTPTDVFFYGKYIIISYHHNVPVNRERARTTLIAYDGETGGQLWKKALQSPLHKLEAKADTLLMFNINNIQAFDLQSGNDKWQLTKLAQLIKPKLPNNHHIQLNQQLINRQLLLQRPMVNQRITVNQYRRPSRLGYFEALRGNMLHLIYARSATELVYRQCNILTGKHSEEKVIHTSSRIHSISHGKLIKNSIYLRINNRQYAYDLTSDKVRNISRTDLNFTRVFFQSKQSNYEALSLSKKIAIYNKQDDQYEYQLTGKSYRKVTISGDIMLVLASGGYELHNLKTKKIIFSKKQRAMILEAKMINDRIITFQYESTYDRETRKRTVKNTLIVYDMQGNVINQQNITDYKYSSRTSFIKHLNDQIMITINKNGIQSWIHDSE